MKNPLDHFVTVLLVAVILAVGYSRFAPSASVEESTLIIIHGYVPVAPDGTPYHRAFAVSEYHAWARLEKGTGMKPDAAHANGWRITRAIMLVGKGD